jgi:hypothetical protein
MIWIDLEHKLPTHVIPGSNWTPWSTTDWQQWLTKSQQFVSQLADLEQQGKRKERNKLIDDNSAHWGKLKDWLIALSGGRCWFTGARDVCSYYDVEHYRPKKEAKDDIAGADRDGYWWLAFDYMNYRLCGTVPNRTKGGWFPLRAGSLCSTNVARCEESETPYLLDPIDEDDVALIAYDHGGKVIPADGCSPWDRDRVTITAKRLKLNEHVPLTEAREKIWNKVNILVDDFLRAKASCVSAPNPAAKEKMKNIRSKLRELTDPNAELAAVAACCLKARNISFLTRLAA